MKSLQQRRQIKKPMKVLGRPDRQSADKPAFEGGDGVAGGLGGEKHPPRCRQKPASGFTQLDASRAAHEQHRPEFILERAYRDRKP